MGKLPLLEIVDIAFAGRKEGELRGFSSLVLSLGVSGLAFFFFFASDVSEFPFTFFSFSLSCRARYPSANPLW